MDTVTDNYIRTTIAPLVQKGNISLLLGAGFTYHNESILGKFPDGNELRKLLLSKLGYPLTSNASLKDLYFLGQDKIPNFDEFLKSIFSAKSAFPWQIDIFKYEWHRIYSTNIDDVLDLALESARSKGFLRSDFKLINFPSPADFSNIYTGTPVVSIHGSINHLSDGFIFSETEYAINAILTRDWMNDVAGTISNGGVIVIGNRLDENDIEAALVRRNTVHNDVSIMANWIVMPSFDEVKRDIYTSRGYHPLECTAEEFFNVLLSEVEKLNTAYGNTATPYYSASRHAKYWFREAFEFIPDQIDNGKRENGIIKRFIMGNHPDWYYIANRAYADISNITELHASISNFIGQKEPELAFMHVIGPSCSGKTTAIRAVISQCTGVTPFIYEFNGKSGFDPELLIEIIKGIKGNSIFVFSSAYEYYYALPTICDRLDGRVSHRVLFILEDRSNDHRMNSRHLSSARKISRTYEMKSISLSDASKIVGKLNDLGIVREGFSNLASEHQAKLIVNKEQGYGGDILATLLSVTKGDRFQDKIVDEYLEISGRSDFSKRIIDYTAICHNFDFPLPTSYLCGFMNENLSKIISHLGNELDGVIISRISNGRVCCRHRNIANYYFNECIKNKGDFDSIVAALKYLSKTFKVADISRHPLGYLIYKNLIQCDFLMDEYFPLDKNNSINVLSVYNEAQNFYGKDAMFWLQYGRAYLRGKHFDDAIECFNTGLSLYPSFQLRHSLGRAYLLRYLDTRGHDMDDLIEGVKLLETENTNRLGNDPYPLATMCDILIKIRNSIGLSDIYNAKLKSGINQGMIDFRYDEYFQSIARNY